MKLLIKGFNIEYALPNYLKLDISGYSTIQIPPKYWNIIREFEIPMTDTFVIIRLYKDAIIQNLKKEIENETIKTRPM